MYVCGSYGSPNDDDDDAACGNGQRQAAAADRAAALTFIGASPRMRDVADRCVLASCGVTGVSRAFNYTCTCTCTCTRTHASNIHGSAILSNTSVLFRLWTRAWYAETTAELDSQHEDVYCSQKTAAASD